jgi:bacillolysin
MKNYLLLLIFTISSFAIIAQDKFKNPKKIDEKNKSKISFDKNLLITKIQANPLKISRGENDLPIFITGKILNPKATKYARGTMESKAFGYLESLKETLKITAPENEFKITTSETDELNQQHIRMDQIFKGIPVYGGEMILHTDGIEVDKLNGRYFPTPKITNLNPTIDQQKAIDLVKLDLKKVSIFQNLTPLEKSVLKYSAPKSELIIYHENEDLNKEFLTWKIEIRPNLIERWEYFVDAKSGKIISKYNTTCAVDGPATATASDLNNISRSVKSYLKGSNYFLIDASKDMFPGGTVNDEDPQGVIWTIDASNTTPEDLSVKQVGSSNNSWLNKTAVSAHYNAGLAYDYYKNKHNRLSLNGKGGTIISIINITETNEKTGAIQQMDNAFWNGEFMGYGNGNSFFKPLAGGLDVAGHEMTHGVIENTANLNYQGQSGAINESMADVFGVLIDRQDGDFVVGEDVMKSGPFLRSLSDPNKGDQPAHMNEIYTGSEDNGGVHINSGIPNKAFHLFVKGLSGNEEQQKIKAEKVYYRALTKYLTRSSKFIDLRAAIVQSCKDLASDVGADAETSAIAAFAGVGIGAGATTSTPTPKPVEDLPANNGSEFILSYDPCDKSIYNSDKTFTNNIVIVKDVIIDHKPSVTDDGSFAYYVAKKALGEGGTLNRVNLSGTPKVEVLSSDEVWSNVAVSKDGKRLAVNTVKTTEDDQKKIYIVNLETGDLKGFPLYNPTYSSTVKSAGTPVYSDALEWEYNGEYVIYDAYNEIKTNSLVGSTAENTINYWDVGLIHAWDVAKNTLSGGTIAKVFTNLAKDESIGNPSFAKKSTSVVAFDRVFDGKYSILTVDFESKGTDGGYKRSEVANNTIGFPEFSASDDKILFNRVVTNRTKGCDIDTTNTGSLNLAADKITYNGTSKLDFIEKSSLAVWYTVGQRQLPKATQVINIALPDKPAGNASTVELAKTTDKGNPVTYKVISGPASIVSGNLALTGLPGKVKLQGDAAGNSTTNAVQTLFEFCVLPVKPTIVVTEKTSTFLLSSSAPTGNVWLKDGATFPSNLTKDIEVNNSSSYSVKVVVDGCEGPQSDAVKVGAMAAQTISVVTIADKVEGDKSSINLSANTSAGNAVIYTIVSGPASISGNQIVLSGQPGRVKVKGTSPATTKNTAAEINYDFCVNPSKPSISITTQATEYLFTSNAATGNNWYRNGVALNVTEKSIQVVTTNTFTVQVVVDGCKSEFSNGATAPKEFVLAEEALEKAGISVYPNPVSDYLILKYGNTKINQVSITNLSGISVFTKEYLKGSELNIDLKSIPKGLYLLNLKTNKGDFSKKLLKE